MATNKNGERQLGPLARQQQIHRTPVAEIARVAGVPRFVVYKITDPNNSSYKHVAVKEEYFARLAQACSRLQGRQVSERSVREEYEARLQRRAS